MRSLIFFVTLYRIVRVSEMYMFILCGWCERYFVDCVNFTFYMFFSLKKWHKGGRYIVSMNLL